jgi:cytochrome c-type biogenesis protein CcmH/NrfG
VTWCRKAAETGPQNPAYTYTLAFYLKQKGEKSDAVKTLESLQREVPGLP